MFAKNFFLFFFGMAVIYSFYLNTRYKGLLKEQDVKIQSSLDSQVKILDNTFSFLKMSVNYLAKNEHTYNHKISIEEIKTHFYTFANSFKNFQQIRWLDLDGKEIVRVERRNNKLYISEDYIAKPYAQEDIVRVLQQYLM